MKYELWDTHCHPQFPQYDTDRDDVISRALSKGIGMICVGTDLETSRTAIALAEQYDGLYASVGLHPNDALGAEFDSAPFESLLSHEKVVSVGEIGLDYYRTKEKDLQAKQTDRLIIQLDMAARHGLPAIIHCRDAHRDMRTVLKERRIGDDTSRKTDTGNYGVVHSFTGTWEDAQAYIDMGYKIGLNGIVTFARDYDEIVTKAPLESILLETDSPFLTPEPHRGKRNEPSYVREVAKKLSALRKVTEEEIIDQTTQNALGVFSKVNGG